MIRQPYGPGRWEGFDRRLAKALDDAIGTGCCEESGDVDGPGWFARVDRSGTGRGGYIISVDSQGFHHAEPFATDRALNHAWANVERETGDWYDDADPATLTIPSLTIRT